MGRRLSVMPGEKYGNLTVEEDREGAKILCRCTCGEGCFVLPRDLRFGNVRACDVCRGERRTKWGHKFGPLKVGDWVGGLQAVEKIWIEYGRQIWRFKCICGGEKLATATEMKRHIIPSCGHCMERGVLVINGALDHYRFLFSAYYNRAIAKNLKFYNTETQPPTLIYDPEVRHEN